MLRAEVIFAGVVIGDGDQEVKEFERAVAIRYEPEPAVAQGTGAAAPR